ncbi:MAG: hypothetical protein F4X66_06715 [Chloroflexi bacterium]|nr:hypothetical protein [Chloroflexota bacterium]MYE39477.1 hypothetical protein [Chloroflexota bacterium]
MAHGRTYPSAISYCRASTGAHSYGGPANHAALCSHGDPIAGHFYTGAIACINARAYINARTHGHSGTNAGARGYFYTGADGDAYPRTRATRESRSSIFSSQRIGWDCH